jgi:Na+/H+ antiporter NhaD/arsenite permease-like protein
MHPSLGLPWAAPLLGVLLSIALLPMLTPRFWHRHMAWVAGFWVAALLLPEAATAGLGTAWQEAAHALLLKYLPFVTLLLALYTAAGGVLVRGLISGTSAGNTGLLAGGTLLAGVMGTTGASMVLINPLLRANAHRQRKMHLVVFFTILVANAGGALSPLGDPPLYLGYLHGVPFFWPLRHLGPPLALLAGLLLPLFYAIDRWLARREPPAPPRERLHVRGWHNAALIVAVLGMVLAQERIGGTLVLAGQAVPTGQIVATLVFLGVTCASVLTTPRAVHQGNDFSWRPMAEVALLFLAIFITIGPVLRMLEAGSSGPFAPVLAVLEDDRGNRLPAAFFWLTGALSAFLDNAPTYLIFFGLADVRPDMLDGARNVLLEALSAGAVFFGGLTYIGNAPNMMVRGVAAHRGVRMPSFLGFLGLTAALLLPAFAVLTLVFFR